MVLSRNKRPQSRTADPLTAAGNTWVLLCLAAALHPPRLHLSAQSGCERVDKGGQNSVHSLRAGTWRMGTQLPRHHTGGNGTFRHLEIIFLLKKILSLNSRITEANKHLQGERETARDLKPHLSLSDFALITCCAFLKHSLRLAIISCRQTSPFPCIYRER